MQRGRRTKEKRGEERVRERENIREENGKGEKAERRKEGKKR